MQDVASLAESIDAVNRQIEAACSRAGRSLDEVTLIAVSKTFPEETIRAAYAAGQRVFGENKVQELAAKASGLSDLPAAEWHMIGHLQRNKAGAVARDADVFHALDSPRLAVALNRKCVDLGKALDCFVQVNVSGEDSKFGLDPDALYPFLDTLAGAKALNIVGLMTLAAPTPNPEDVRPQFRLLRTLAEAYRPSDGANIKLESLSMGMSGDFEIAIEEGATHVRVGSAIFGARSYL